MVNYNGMKNSNIYFAASISGGREDVQIYSEIINYLKNYGNVLTEMIGDKNLGEMGESLDDIFIHDRDMKWLNESNILVAEVTTASHGVGYELGRMVERNLWIPKYSRRHILCLYRPKIDKRLSAMINGSDGLICREYNKIGEAKTKIDSFFMKMGLKRN